MDIQNKSLAEIKYAAERSIKKHKKNVNPNDLTIRQLEKEAERYQNHLAHSVAWKNKNKERQKVYNKEYANNHLADRAAYMRAYRAKKKEERLEKIIADAKPTNL